MKKLISAMLAAAAIVSLAACAANKPVPEPDEPSRSSPSYPVPAEEPIEDEPAMPTAAAETTAETYFDETLPVADETDSRYASDPNGEPEMPEAAEEAKNDPYDEASLTAYAAELAHFFPQPLESPEYLTPGRSFAFFLLRRTYLDTLASGVSYKTENGLIYIPESDLENTAARRLGLVMTAGDVFEWPFGEPESGLCPYDPKAELPEVGIDGASVSTDENAGAAAVSVTLYDIKTDSPEHTTLIYRFVLSSDKWRLMSIDPAE